MSNQKEALGQIQDQLERVGLGVKLVCSQKLEEVAGERGVLGTPLRLLPLLSGTISASESRWTDGSIN